ncbi:hypothetical protein JZ751_015831 [Albula glossodonta]|uniref:LysM and putative peptidoglycan-binding domain-containing protein 4 n=1 Tax=Albula glossodonta TaxID=121402 RepID=A0A8T2MVY0_9TELE|nr:hypothetical protein JZ751_015831 [Albula glossodonta]
MWQPKPVRRAFQAAVNVRSAGDGQVYLFRGGPEDAASSEEEEELVVTELRPRGPEWAGLEREKAGDIQLLERALADGDNLNKLALQYGCKVADLKRVNNLMQEQDLYALKSVKIPVRKHGLLTETPPPGPPSPTEPPPSVSQRPEGYADFLQEMDRDIERLAQSSSGQQGEPSDVAAEVLQLKPRSTPDQHGADWGIQWWNAVALMLLVGVILPLFCVFYYRTQDGTTATMTTPGLDDHMGNVSLFTSNSNTSLTNVSAVALPAGSISQTLNKPPT